MCHQLEKRWNICEFFFLFGDKEKWWTEPKKNKSVFNQIWEKYLNEKKIGT